MKFFSKVLEIRSKAGVLHFTRWAIFQCRYFGLYFHRINEADKDLHLHSHPWNSMSFILKGSYEEELNEGRLKIKKFLTFSKMNRSVFHKVKRIIKGPVYSLFFTYGEYQAWFYKVKQTKIESTLYRDFKREGTL